MRRPRGGEGWQQAAVEHGLVADDRGRAVAHLKVAKTMFEVAIESRDVGALKWWTATQLKWTQASAVENTPRLANLW